MKRAALALLLPLLALIAWLPAGPVHAENADWTGVAREFKDKFKTKNPLKDRIEAVKVMAKSQDARGVRELLKVVNTQQKHAQKLRKEYVMEEQAWQEKTDRLQKQIDRKREQSSDGRITVTEEEDDWLGLTDKYRAQGGPTAKMMIEKDRIQKLYRSVLEEEDVVPYIFKSIARLVNSLDGDEKQKALTDTVNAAKRTRDDEEKVAMIGMLAFIVGDDATDALVTFSGDTDVDIAVRAYEALGRQNSEKGMRRLIEGLGNPQWQLRAAAITGLSFYHEADAVEALIAAAKKEEGVLQRKYYAALARIVQEQVPGTVEAWESFWRENKEDLVARWKNLPKGEPIENDPPDIPIDTDLGSTSFYGIRTNSKHIIFVVDVSGSMGEQGGTNEQGEQRIDVARKELKAAIQSLSASDEDERGAASFNVVLYSTVPMVYQEGKMITATVKNKEKAFEWIDEKVKPTDQTNIFDAIEQAFNIISEKKEKKNLEKGADTIFLMTDGFPNRGRFIDFDLILREVKEMNKTRKMTIHTIGVGQGHNRPFLTQLAAQNDGQYLAR